MVYEKQSWVNGASGNTPVNGPRMSHIEDGIDAAHDDLATMQDKLDDKAPLEALQAVLDALQAASARIAALETATPRLPLVPAALNFTLRDNAAQLTWAAPADSGTSPVLDYTYGDGTQSFTTTDLFGTLPGLVRGATTTAAVSARTAAGTGPAATVLITVPVAVANTPTAPTGLSITTSGTSATLTWAAPSSDGGSTITGYYPSRNGADANGAGPYRASTPLAATARTATFQSLIPGSTYALSVEAANSSGSGAVATATVTMPAVSISYTTRRLSHPFWTTPLNENAPLASTSTTMVSRLTAQFNARTTGTTPSSSYDPPFNTDVATGNYSMCIYEVPGGTTRQRVYSKRDKYFNDTASGAVIHLQQILDAGVPLPDPTQIRGGTIAPSGTDGSIIVIDKDTHEEWEMWQVTPALDGSTAKNAGYDWQCTQGGYMRDYRFHPGWWSGSGDGNTPRGGDLGVSASGFAYLGMILTGADFAATDITHPLTLALPITGGNGSDPSRLLPATRNDEFNFTPTDTATADAYRVPEGARFRLNPAKYTNAYITTYANQKGKTTADGSGSTAATLAKVLRCLRDYGVIIGDSSQILGWSAEHQKTFGGPYNPITTSPTWGDFGQQVPYADLMQVAVPTAQFHAQGAGPSTMPAAAYDFSLNPGTLGVQVVPDSQRTVDTGTTTGFYASRGNGGTVSIVNGKLRWTYATATNTNVLDPGPAASGIPVTPGKKYRAMLDVTRVQGTSTLQCVISFRGSSGQVGSGVGPVSSAPSGQTVTFTADGTAPAAAATATIYMHQGSVAPSNGDTYDLDNIRLYEVL